jgi:pimeloyl-ACP methyl ester carboxylesterase
MRKWTRQIWVACGVLFIAFLVLNTQARGVGPEVFRSTAAVQVLDTGELIQFLPTHEAPGAGLIFLPGGGIDPDAYAPLLRSVAESGHSAVIVKVPWRVAPTGATRSTLWRRIAGVLASGGPQQAWVLGGHSRGAVFALTYATEHPRRLAGLALIGTTHPRDIDLYNSKLPILKIVGTKDCVASLERVMANARLLPPGTQWARIEGGNHRQFGYYGYQLGDCGATITRESQQKQTATALVKFLGTAGR